MLYVYLTMSIFAKYQTVKKYFFSLFSSVFHFPSPVSHLALVKSWDLKVYGSRKYSY